MVVVGYVVSIAGDLLETAAGGAGATGDLRWLRLQRHIVDVEIVHGRCIGEAIAVRRQLDRLSDLLASGAKRAAGEENERVGDRAVRAVFVCCHTPKEGLNCPGCPWTALAPPSVPPRANARTA